jgi:short subunit dehydrogenase-like uncharacterized protein
VVTDAVWVLGGTGRSGRAIASSLLERGIEPVLVGRNAALLTETAARLGAARTVVAASADEMAIEIARQRPAVVINTVGPFTRTAEPILRACLPSSHYIDLANDLAAVLTTLRAADAASTAGRSVVTGAGFGVTATESTVVALRANRPAPIRVRVDMVPSLATEAGTVGEAMAATVLEGLPGVPGGRRFESRRFAGGRLVRARLGGAREHLRLPDGSTVVTGSMPLGELVAAQRASGAPDVISASSEAPSAPVIRAVLPLLGVLLAGERMRRFAQHRLAAVRLSDRQPPRPHSWGHARLEWADGTVGDGWLRIGDAQAFTGAVPAEVAARLLAGAGRAGASTPAAMFGLSLAEACGATYLLGDTAAGEPGRRP